MQRHSILAFGLVVYLLFLGVFLHAVFFVQGVFVPRTLSSGGVVGPVGTAILVDVGLLLLFAAQHNIMARPWFKRRWTRVVHPALERSLFVLATIAILEVMIACWRPMDAVIWSVRGPAATLLTAVSWGGWALVLLSTFVIDHFDLFGLKQVLRHHRGLPAHEPRFQVKFLYHWTRHPLYLGFVIAFWCTPVMTASHLLFAGVTTAWILLTARVLEERDLVGEFGESYVQYRAKVPMLLPLRIGRASTPAAASPKRDTVQVQQ